MSESSLIAPKTRHSKTLDRCTQNKCPLWGFWDVHRAADSKGSKSDNGDVVVVIGVPYPSEMEEFNNGRLLHPMKSGSRAEVILSGLKDAGFKTLPKVVFSVRCSPQSGVKTAAKLKLTRGAIPYCSKYLKKSVAGAKVIIAAGATAVHACTGSYHSVNKIHGRKMDAKKELGGIPVIPVFDPFQVQKSPEKYSLWVSDLRMAEKYLSGDPFFSPDKLKRYHIHSISSVEDVKKAVDATLRSSVIALDTETNGLDDVMFKPGFRTKLVQFGGFEWDADENMLGMHVYCVSPDKEGKWADEVIKEFNKLGRSNKLVLHNAKYDLKVLRTIGCEAFIPLMDTMLTHSALHGFSSSQLKQLAYSMSDLGGYEKMLEGKLPGDVPEEVMVSYGALDVVVTAIVACKLKSELDNLSREHKDRFLSVINMLSILAAAFADIEYTGMPFDLLAHKEFSFIVRDSIEEVKKKIFEDKDVKIFVKDNKLNLNGGPSVSNLLFWPKSDGGIGLPVIERSEKTDEPSAKASVLDELKDAHPVVPLIRTLRALTKLNNSFCSAYPGFVSPITGHIHPTYWLAKTENIEGRSVGAGTGRLSCSNPNLQQTPKRDSGILPGFTAKQIREAFVPLPGHYLIEADQSQVEIVTAAMYSQDKKMIAMINSGGDFHRLTAGAISGVPVDEVSDQQRGAAKSINFGILYGMGAATLKKRIGIPAAEAEKFLADHKKLFPELEEWRQKIIAFAVEKGYVDTLFGRRRLLKVIKGKTEDGHEERQGVNTPIQSVAADITFFGIVAVWEMIQGIWGPAGKEIDLRRPYILGSVHDSLIISVPAELLSYFLPVVKRLMEDPPRIPWLREYGVKLRVDIEVGPNLMDMEKVQFDGDDVKLPESFLI